MTFNYTKRRTFTAKQRQAFFIFHNGICYLCGATIKPSVEAWEIEHVIARELLGPDADADDNLALAHKKCHADKTRRDRKAIAKSNHVQVKAMGAHRPAGKLRGAPFPKRPPQHSATRELARKQP